MEVQRTGWVREGDRLVQRLRIKTDATVPDYAIVIWGIPWRPGARAVDVRSTATRHQVAYNRKGERHLVLTFDLKPNAELELSVPVAWAGATMR